MYPNVGIAGIVMTVLDWLASINECFTRHTFGERYWNVTRVVVAYLILRGVEVVGNLSMYGYTVRLGASLLPWFTAIFVLLSVYHIVQIILRNRRREPWYSYSFGVSRLDGISLPLFGGDDWVYYRLYEPAACFIVALLIGRVDTALGVTLAVSSIALLIKNNVIYAIARGILLDGIDAQLLATYQNEQVAKHTTPKTKMAGIASIPNVWPKMPTPPSSMEDIEKTVQETQGKRLPQEPDEPAPAASLGDATMDFSDTINDTLS